LQWGGKLVARKNALRHLPVTLGLPPRKGLIFVVPRSREGLTKFLMAAQSSIMFVGGRKKGVGNYEKESPWDLAVASGTYRKKKARIKRSSIGVVCPGARAQKPILTGGTRAITSEGGAWSG